jgi:hypothetical protein
VAGFFMRGRIAGMRRQVFRENWQQQLQQVIDDVLTAAGSHANYERETLVGEMERLRELLRQVRDVSPHDRVPVDSFLIPRTTRETLNLPRDLVDRIGEVFEIYHRFRTHLTWID